MTPRIRPARAEDDRLLGELDVAGWEPLSSPAPRPDAGTPFFSAAKTPEGFLVAEEGGRIVGYIALGPALPLASSSHVLEVQGLVVSPEHRGEGVGRLLVEAAIETARREGARRLTLRVLAPNTAARRLYEACGFTVEGILRETFLLDDAYVDDVLMAVSLR